MTNDLDPELQAMLDALAAVKGWLGRAWRFGWRPILGRVVTLTAALAVLFGLLCFARPPVHSYPMVKVVISQATDADTGMPVSRDQWIRQAAANQP